MKTFDIITPIIYAKGEAEQTINSSCLNRTHNIIRINNQVEQSFLKTCSQISFKKQRSLNQRNERRNKR